MSEHPADPDQLAERAAECLLCLKDPDAEPAAKLRWRAWLSESPAHRRAFAACRRAWRLSAGVDIAWPTAAEIAADPYRAEAPIPLPNQRGRPGRPEHPGLADAARARLGSWSGLRVLAATAALLLAAVFAATALRGPREAPEGPDVYATGRGEQKQLTLQDGSTVMLGPQSRLEVSLGPDARTFHLRSGEAIFTATHDARRPFRVYAGNGWVEDVGTAFDVRSDPDRVTVTVLQGEVIVGPLPRAGEPGPGASARLSRNQQIAYGRTMGPVHAVDAAMATSWREGQLAYVDRPLGEVVDDLRRYSMKDIVLADRSIGALRYTGTISVRAIDQWAIGLARVYPVRIEIRGDRLILGARRATR